MALEPAVRTPPAPSEALRQRPRDAAYLHAHPRAAENFNAAMTGFAEATRTAVAQAYDFSGIETLVDVGGGHGALLASVLAAHPSLRGVLFDLPTAIEGARGEVAARGLASRCELVAGDFFAAVPAGADAYILTGILHDWDDERSVAILRCRRRAIRASGRLLIGEQVLPEGGEPFFGKLLDLEMLVLVGGRERTEDEVPGPARPRRLRAGAGVPSDGPTSVLEAFPV